MGAVSGRALRDGSCSEEDVLSTTASVAPDDAGAVPPASWANSGDDVPSWVLVEDDNRAFCAACASAVASAFSVASWPGTFKRSGFSLKRSDRTVVPGAAQILLANPSINTAQLNLRILLPTFPINSLY